ncbi:Conserved_hypothetical protein [Hexamita inflata]|uniref:Uncharacterized protein n=1 Tax=Hexamita inflata TaxID=28002 RepID=A0AA86TTS5_9EUKA|nr:Conserved hypothetical protein [Hexamita inflata]
MYLSNADQMQTQKSALPQVLESRERKQRLANSSVKVQLIQEQKQFRINEQIEITKRVKEAQLKKQQEIVQKQLQEQQNQKERAEQIRARFEQKEQELKRLKLEKAAKFNVDQDQPQQNSNPANEQNFNPDFERTLKQKQEEELQKRILEEQREAIEAQKLLQKKKDAEEQKRKLELERSQQTEFILQKKKDETTQLLTKRLQDLKELNSQTELNKHKEHLLLLKQQEENEMRIRQSQNRTNSQIMFIQERKTLMKELDKIKLAQIENRTILQKQQQQLEEENKLKKIKPVTFLYSKSTPKEPNVKQTIRIDVMQKQPRDEYVLFFNKPKSIYKTLENVKIFDELQRLEAYVYMHKFNINWSIPEINTKEEFEAENEKIFGLQKEWVQNLNLIRNEQQVQNSPAIQQLDIILQLETQLLPAFQYCKCVGDIKTLIEETTQLRKIQIQMVNPEKDRQIFEKLQNEKLAQIEQYGYVLEALLHEQIEKRNKKLSGIERVIGLNQEFEFQLLQVESIDAYYACVRKYEREIQGTELDLVE